MSVPITNRYVSSIWNYGTAGLTHLNSALWNCGKRIYSVARNPKDYLSYKALVSIEAIFFASLAIGCRSIVNSIYAKPSFLLKASEERCLLLTFNLLTAICVVRSTYALAHLIKKYYQTYYINQIPQVISKSQTSSMQKKGIFLVLESTDDHNGAFKPSYFDYCNYKTIAKKLSISIAKISEPEDIETAVKTASEKGPIKILHIRAHGSRDRFSFTDDFIIHGIEPEFQNTLESIKASLKMIVFRSCSTGNTIKPTSILSRDEFYEVAKGLKHGFENRCLSKKEIDERIECCVAQRVAQLCPGVTVIAPTKESTTATLKVTINPDSSETPLNFSHVKGSYCQKHDFTAVFKVPAKT